ncbi:1,3-beta-glucan synthase component-domain-containing protein [Blakeslea trispora]|nr:1,3-beta-glucan synthase component-domain-containing protein [Blakeslea trispora]
MHTDSTEKHLDSTTQSFHCSAFTIELGELSYPNWESHEPPLSYEDIGAIFINYERKYGFQHDNIRNIYDHLLTMLDSRASRMSSKQALWTLHADYIGGEHANYRKWYFTAHLDLDDHHTPHRTPTGLLLEEAKREWRERMESMSDMNRAAQLSLYLLIWGEAATLRYLPECLESMNPPGTIVMPFLDAVVSPIYDYMRDQCYQIIKHHYVRKEKDHQNILFWSKSSIAKLRLKPTENLAIRYLNEVPKERRYLALSQVDWSSAFSKTFYESRSWLHLLTNFSRVWIIHATSFWYYMAASVDFIYLDRIAKTTVKLSAVGLGGLVAILLMMLATLAEFKYLRLTSSKFRILSTRLILLFFYIFKYDQKSTLALILSSCQLGVGAIISIVLAIIPSSNLFHRQNASEHLACKAFTASFPEMMNDDRFLSIMLWLCVFSCKFLETYFFLALSFRDALSVTSLMYLDNCSSDPLLGKWLCTAMPILTTILMFFVELALFFLDTYLWYVIWNTIFSVSQSMQLGISVMTSWKQLFTLVPRNMFAKIAATKEFVSARLRRMACSQMWNAIIISMYRDHLLSMNNLQSLLYQVQVEEDEDGDIRRQLQVPPIFNPTLFKIDDYFPPHSEAERRLSFFAQSLSTDIPVPSSVQTMPTFTVFTPHYAEKMLLSLREIIREEDTTTRVTLLEYLKRLYPAEWNNFVKDTMFIAEESDIPSKPSEKDDLPFYCIGFKSSAPEYTFRTRVWASLRAQTLYRTINGFMNYARALKILYRIENPNLNDILMAPPTSHLDGSRVCLNRASSSDIEFADDETDIDPFEGAYGEKRKDTEELLDAIAHQKFRFLVAMQRYAKFNAEENESCEYLLNEYPHLQIAYIEEEHGVETGQTTFYSVLIDGKCDLLPNNKRKPKYRIQLPGNPILGDGKSDNQNHALIFYRGEYLQLVDANQDNYLEECLKIRSIFGEFEQKERQIPLQQIYALDNTFEMKESNPSLLKQKPPVAIVGAREYIFSENVGMLGDVAAGKEQTFGTLTQRIMAKTGGRLHYGHPDFLNAVFMTTRGGVSKAQRGLHLNEDIYAGMNALLRGGRIKHTEYLQCGKGRDLGFCSILNFTTKIGTGMGEQLLSREYYYLGTQLPLDRFLTFYYAHPGFHMNNIMIIFAVQVFLFCMTLVGTMAAGLPHCKGDNCFDVRPVYDWLQRCILSIFMVFFIAFLPLFLQELTEKGAIRSIWRLIKQFLSLSPLFEVFVTQIYANSVLSNLSFGGARYIATGRGFATSRLPFSVLYSRFAHPSIYFGARTMFMLFFVSVALWIPHLIYFWATVTSLLISPFVFNPHQFVLIEFINDYREYLGWLSRGNSTLQRFIFKTFVGMFLTRELHHDATNRAWWSGKWIKSRVSNLAAREYICKIVEMSIFTTDFILGHLILFVLFPFTLIPSIDRMHSMILFWLRPSKQIRPSVLPTKERRRRRKISYVYGPVFLLVLAWFVALIIAPLMLEHHLPTTYTFITKYF